MEKIKEFLDEQKKEVARYLCDISADFVGDYKNGNAGGDIDDAFRDYADDAVDIYYSDLFEWAKNNFEYVDRARDELGASGDIIGDLQAGQFLQKFNTLNNDRQDIIKYLTFDLLENTPALALFLGLDRLQELAEVGDFDIWDFDNIFDNLCENFDDLDIPEIETFEKIDKVLETPENIKAIKHNADAYGFSILIEHKPADVAAWVDVWIEDKDISADWNAYIFSLDDSNDLAQKTIQENANLFDYFTSAAIDYLQAAGLIRCDKGGAWVRV